MLQTLTRYLIPILIVSLLLPSSLPTTSLDNQKDLYLLRVEHYLELAANEDTSVFHVKYVFPPDYGYQTPIILEVFNDTNIEILNYRIDEDKCIPNRVVNFTLPGMHKGEHKLLHFTIWTLVENFEFQDIPSNISFPSRKELPEETLVWLQPTKVVQVYNPLIILKAKQLRRNSGDVFDYAKKVARFIKYHRFLLFLLELRTGVFLSQDAVTTLLINGENVGRSHLACALFRSQNIPARVLLANNDQGFWTQMHYMVEYYLPNYGWVLLDSTKGETPYATKRQIINRICCIEDEMNTKRDYIFPLMTGEERWIWLDTDKIQPYYVDCREGSKSQMFQEAEITVDEFTSRYAFLKTKLVFHSYEHFQGSTLDDEDTLHFNKAVSYQRKAVHILAEDEDIYQYMYYMDKAYNEYLEIEG